MGQCFGLFVLVELFLGSLMFGQKQVLSLIHLCTLFKRPLYLRESGWWTVTSRWMRKVSSRTLQKMLCISSFRGFISVADSWMFTFVACAGQWNESTRRFHKYYFKPERGSVFSLASYKSHPFLLMSYGLYSITWLSLLFCFELIV